MYLLTRVLPILMSVSALLGTEYALGHAERFIRIMSLTLVVLAVAMIVMLRRSSTGEHATLLAPLLVFFFGTAFALFFLSPWWIRHIVAVVAALSILVYTEEVYRYAYEPERYHQHALEHLAGYLSVLALAGSTAGVFALRIFLNTRLLYLLPLTFLIAIAVSAAVFAVQPLSRKSLLSSVVVLGILVTETAWSVYFLPTSFFVDSLIVTIPFYVALHLIRHELNGTLTVMTIQRYSTVGVIAMFIVLITAQWVL